MGHMSNQHAVDIGPYQEQRKIEAELANWLPSMGDQLLVSTADATVVDCLGFTADGEERSPIGRDSLYSNGYLLAADRLVESLAGVAFEDCLIYPVFYLYRHYIELELKGSIKLFLSCLYKGSQAGRERQLAKLAERHSIQVLWDKLKSLSPTTIARMSLTATEAFHCLVRQID